jgi:chloramphenicol O-acetyltransferase
MDLENEIVKETKKLDSEMQTLVSENYNKFISATDTIRKMRNDFKKMEEEMENLVINMSKLILIVFTFVIHTVAHLRECLSPVIRRMTGKKKAANVG